MWGDIIVPVGKTSGVYAKVTVSDGDRVDIVRHDVGRGPHGQSLRLSTVVSRYELLRRDLANAMTRRQQYALTHPLDESTIRHRMPHCTRRTVLDDGLLLTTILAVDR